MATRRGRRYGIVLAIWCCLATTLAAGCGGSDGARLDGAAETPAAVPPVAASSPDGSASGQQAPDPAPRPSSAPPAELTLAFAGDVHFTGRTADLLESPQTVFGALADPLSEADLAVVNLETAVTDRGTPEPKTYHFRAPTSAFAALQAAGIDAASLANNHALDYGQVGLVDTLDNAGAAGFPVFGAGRDATGAYAPWITRVHGVRVAVFGFSQVDELASTWAATDERPGLAMAGEAERAVAAVAQARQQADLVIVFNHWGEEGSSCPDTDQRAFARRLADAGADVIVGSHAHTLQGAGYLGDTYVAYGLGNFLWYGSSFSTETGVLRLTVRGRTVTRSELIPAVVSANGQPVPLSGSAASRVTDRFARLRGCTGLTEAPAPAGP